MAASTIVPSVTVSGTGTVWQFINNHAVNAQASTCYRASARPSETFTCLKAALQTTGLDAMLQEKNHVTLFAPTDAGFRDLAHLMGTGAFQQLMQ
ncbi:MAG: fasciclin domain-containing protein, partial [Deinococcales bacterium]